jgi:hypothetical protein
MRIISAIAVAALVCCVPLASAPAQGVGVSVGLDLGNARVVSSYNADRHGDWHTSYKQWEPTTLYYTNGQYYDKQTKGSRTVSVYKKDDGYFLPPQDKKFSGVDKRYDYKHKPTADDYKRNP